MTTDSILHYFDDPLWAVLLRLIINLAALYIIVFLVYSRFAKSKENMFPMNGHSLSFVLGYTYYFSRSE